MNERIKQLAEQANVLHTEFFDNEWEVKKFAELIVADYAQQQVQANMSNPAYAQAMDEYYEKKWSHRFDD